MERELGLPGGVFLLCIFFPFASVSAAPHLDTVRYRCASRWGSEANTSAPRKEEIKLLILNKSIPADKGREKGALALPCTWLSFGD